MAKTQRETSSFSVRAKQWMAFSILAMMSNAALAVDMTDIGLRRDDADSRVALGNSHSNFNVGTTDSKVSGASPAAFDYEALVSLIQNQHLTSMEEVLPQLPVEMRSNYTLVHHSRSLQHSTYENPRAILFGKDASFVCTFNGEKDQIGYDVLECMQFRRATASFDFRQIQFPTLQNGLKEVAFSSSGQTSDGRISCTMCHTSDPRPNWLVYANWTGSYGADDDGLKKELKQYLGFVAKRDQHPRYKYLIQGKLPTDPYIVTGNAIENRPNLRLSDLLGRMNSLRDTRVLKSVARRDAQLKFAFSALSCELEPEDESRLLAMGFKVDLELDADKVLSDLKINPLDWSMRMGIDTHGESVFDHQGGFSFLNIDVAMGIVTEEAKTDDMLRRALLSIQNYYEQNYPIYAPLKPAAGVRSNRSYQGDYLRTLNSYMLDPDYFGQYGRNKSPICLELSHLLTHEIAGTKP